MVRVAIAASVFFIFLSCGSKSTKIESKDDNEWQYEEGVHAAFYNGKGDRISISTTKGRLMVVDTMLNVLRTVQAHEGRANSCFFSVDDRFIITGGQDEFLNVWNSDDLSLFNRFQFDFNSYTSVHGYRTLGGCGNKGKVVIYDLVEKDTIALNLEEDGANHLYYVAVDTTLVVSSGLHGYEVDVLNGEVTRKYRGHSDRVYCIMPSNDASLVVTASADSTVKVFDSQSEELLRSTGKLDGRAYVACFSHDDSTIVASTSTGSIYFFDSSLASVQMKINAFETRINTIHYSPDGKRMVAGSEGAGVKIFATETGELLYSLSHLP